MPTLRVKKRLSHGRVNHCADPLLRHSGKIRLQVKGQPFPYPIQKKGPDRQRRHNS